MDKDEIYCAPNFCWRSPVTMSEWMSRITVEITNVHVEQLQEITIDDVMIEIYAEYWNKYNPKNSWKSNPWI